MIIEDALFVPFYVSESKPKQIRVVKMKSLAFGTSLMSGGKGATADGSIEEESTVIVTPTNDPVQVWG